MYMWWVCGVIPEPNLDLLFASLSDIKQTHKA